MNPTAPLHSPSDETDGRKALTRPKELRFTWTSFFVSVVVHINLLLIFAVTFRALQETDDRPLMIETTFTPGEEEEISISPETEDDVVPVEEVVFKETAPQSAEDMVRSENELDLPGLEGLGGARGLGGGSGAGGVGFFGTSARGRSFVFVVDCSGSMQGNRFRRAVEELQKSLNQLESDQQFQVIFFNNQAHPLTHPTHSTKLLPAKRSMLQHAMAWIGNQHAAGGTHPNDALTRALALKPDVVFFLTDAHKVPRTVRTLIAEENSHGSTVHTIAFGHRGGETLMQGIAADHRGRYRYVP